MKINLKIDELSDIFGIKSPTWRQVLLTIPGCVMALGSGMTFGMSAVLLPQIREDKTIRYDPSHESWIASGPSLSMVIASLCSGTLLDHYGRKRAHIVMGIPYIAGWITMACAPSTSIIILARLLTGLSSGTIISVSLVYFGEIASPKIRTLILPFPGLMFNLGMLLTHVLGHYLYWKWCAVVCVFPPVFVIASAMFLKESPLWLIAQGKIDDGTELFRWLRGSNEESEAELRSVLRKNSENTESAEEKLKLLRTSAFIKPMLILFVVMMNVQLSGVNAIGFYAQDIFEQTFSGNLDSFLVMVIMDCIVSLVSAAICFLGTYIPKKKLYLLSNFGVFVFLLGLVVWLHVGYNSYLWVPLICLVFYLCFGTAILMLSWTFVPEILPSNGRGLGSGINSAFSYILLFTIAKITPDSIKLFGISTLFAIIGLSTLICGIILCFVLPDTDGKTLQSIEDKYNRKRVESP